MSNQRIPLIEHEAAEITADALRFLAACARLQDMIDWLVFGYVDAAPVRGWQSLGAVLKNPARHRDEDTPKVIAKIAEQVGVHVQLSEFANYFKHIKDLRNFMAHSMVLEAVKSDNQWVLHVGSYHNDRRARRVLVDNDVSLAALHQAGAKQLWLMKQVEWIRISAELPGGPSALAWAPEMPEGFPTF